MAGAYKSEYYKFNNKYKVSFDVSEHYDKLKRLSGINDFRFDADPKKTAIKLYTDTLTRVLSVKLASISAIGEGKFYGESDFSIGEFIEDFDKLMQAKFADEVGGDAHEPLEGATYAEIANAVWKGVKHFDKPTPDVWADSIIKGDLTIEDIKKVVDPVMERLNGGYDSEWKYMEKSDYLNVYMAKQAMDKAIAGRSFLWKLWPGNWGQWYRENQFSKQLENDLLTYNLLNTGFSEDSIKEFTEKSMFSGVKNKLNEFLKEKAANKTASNEMEQALDEKIFNDGELEDILDQRAAHEDKVINDIIARENQKKLEEQNREAQIMASFKKPTNRIEVKKVFSNRNITQVITNQFVSLMANATNTNAEKSAKANSLHNSFGMIISESWVDQKNMHSHAVKFFKVAYNAIKNDTPGMSVSEKLVAAQKMADIMLNTYSPVATNPSLAQYGESYAVQKLDNDNIKELTGFEGNVNELMNNVKTELGIGKEKVNFGNEFAEAGNDKSAKVEDHKAPVIENVKQH